MLVTLSSEMMNDFSNGANAQGEFYNRSVSPFNIILGFLRFRVSAMTCSSDIHMNRNQAGYLKILKTVVGSTMTCMWR